MTQPQVVVFLLPVVVRFSRLQEVLDNQRWQNQVVCPNIRIDKFGMKTKTTRLKVDWLKSGSLICNGFSRRKHRAFWKQKYPHKYGYF